MKYEYNAINNTTPLGDRLLNKLGEEGWELVSHAYDSIAFNHYYTFKREKISLPKAIPNTEEVRRFKLDDSFKEELENRVRPQDPAIDITTNPEGINVWKELYDRFKLTSLVDDLNVIDTRDEIDKKEDTKKEDRDFMYKWIREKSGK